MQSLPACAGSAVDAGGARLPCSGRQPGCAERSLATVLRLQSADCCPRRGSWLLSLGGVQFSGAAS